MEQYPCGFRTASQHVEVELGLPPTTAVTVIAPVVSSIGSSTVPVDLSVAIAVHREQGHPRHCGPVPVFNKSSVVPGICHKCMLECQRGGSNCSQVVVVDKVVVGRAVPTLYPVEIAASERTIHNSVIIHDFHALITVVYDGVVVDVVCDTEGVDKHTVFTVI